MKYQHCWSATNTLALEKLDRSINTLSFLSWSRFCSIRMSTLWQKTLFPTCLLLLSLKIFCWVSHSSASYESVQSKFVCWFPPVVSYETWLRTTMASLCLNCIPFTWSVTTFGKYSLRHLEVAWANRRIPSSIFWALIWQPSTNEEHLFTELAASGCWISSKCSPVKFRAVCLAWVVYWFVLPFLSPRGSWHSCCNGCRSNTTSLMPDCTFGSRTPGSSLLSKPMSVSKDMYGAVMSTKSCEHPYLSMIGSLERSVNCLIKQCCIFAGRWLM